GVALLHGTNIHPKRYIASSAWTLWAQTAAAHAPFGLPPASAFHALVAKCREQLHIALPARGAAASTVAEDRASAEATTGATAEVREPPRLRGWLVFRKGTSCRTRGDPGAERYRATKLLLRLGMRAGAAGLLRFSKGPAASASRVLG